MHFFFIPFPLSLSSIRFTYLFFLSPSILFSFFSNSIQFNIKIITVITTIVNKMDFLIIKKNQKTIEV